MINNKFGFKRKQKRVSTRKFIKVKASPIDLRTIYVGQPWWVQLAVGFGTSLVMNKMGTHEPTTVISQTVPMKHLIASQAIASTTYGISKKAIVSLFLMAKGRSTPTPEPTIDTFVSHPIVRSIETQTDASLTSSTILDALPGDNAMWMFGLSLGARYLISKYIINKPINKDTTQEIVKEVPQEGIEEVKEAILEQANVVEGVKTIAVPGVVVSLGSNVALGLGAALGIVAFTGLVTYAAHQTWKHLEYKPEPKPEPKPKDSKEGIIMNKRNN